MVFSDRLWVLASSTQRLLVPWSQTWKYFMWRCLQVALFHHLPLCESVGRSFALLMLCHRPHHPLPFSTGSGARRPLPCTYKSAIFLLSLRRCLLCFCFTCCQLSPARISTSSSCCVHSISMSREAMLLNRHMHHS